MKISALVVPEPAPLLARYEWQTFSQVVAAAFEDTKTRQTIIASIQAHNALVRHFTGIPDALRGHTA